MTFLHSLISGPRAIQETERAFTDATSLAGGRFAAQVGDFVEVGLHAVSAHQTNSVADQLVETLHKGSLTNKQNQTDGQIEILLKDDSPEDGLGGAAFFPDASDVVIYLSRWYGGAQGRDIRFGPVIEGGLERRGFLSADGSEQISLLYDFDSASFVNRAAADKAEIVAVEFRLVLANDYQVLDEFRSPVGAARSRRGGCAAWARRDLPGST